MNPIPIVKMVNVSFNIEALIKKNNRAVQTSSTKSTGGGLSVKPLINAKRLGTVDPCKNSIAIQPIVSAENFEILESKNSLILSVIV